MINLLHGFLWGVGLVIGASIGVWIMTFSERRKESGIGKYCLKRPDNIPVISWLQEWVEFNSTKRPYGYYIHARTTNKDLFMSKEDFREVFEEKQ